MYDIIPLSWTKRDFWVAETPAARSGYISIALEEGKYWPLWSCDLPGFSTLDEAMAAGQEFHDNFLKKYLR